MGRRSLATATTSAPTLPPESRDSARFSTTESEYTSRALSTWKSSAKTVRTIVEIKVSYDVSFSMTKFCSGIFTVLSQSKNLFDTIILCEVSVIAKLTNYRRGYITGILHRNICRLFVDLCFNFFDVLYKIL